ncbi:MAG: sulfite exporter TauE/SafE family protein [Reichenbachiella sp.]
MDWLDVIIVLFVGLVTGVINTLAGGGSLLTLPLLIFMGLPPAVANGTNRIGIMLQSIIGVFGFKSKGVSSFRYSLLLAISAVIGAIIGAKIAIDLKGEVFNKILAVIMIMVMFITIFNPLKSKKDLIENLSAKRKSLTVFLFFFVGIYGGFIQAGVGFVIIAVLMLVNHLPMAKVNSIKVSVVSIYTLFALAVFVYEDQVNWPIGLLLAAGSSLGAWISSRWSVVIDDKWIRYFLIFTVTGMALKLWFY